MIRLCLADSCKQRSATRRSTVAVLDFTDEYTGHNLRHFSKLHDNSGLLLFGSTFFQESVEVIQSLFKIGPIVDHTVCLVEHTQNQAFHELWVLLPQRKMATIG